MSLLMDKNLTKFVDQAFETARLIVADVGPYKTL